jgi:hypothetical protein
MATLSESPGEPKGAPREREPLAQKREATRGAGDEGTEQLIFTLRPTTGEVVRIEKVDSAGRRSDIPKDETVALAGKQGLGEIEAALDEAFEAGIFSVLDPGGNGEEAEETPEEMDLRRVLLKLVIGREVRRRLQRRLVQRLILSRTTSH